MAACTASRWSQQEDDRLRKLIDQHGAKKWSLIASLLGSKGSKQCRRRWKNFLNAELKTGGWTKEEDQILADGHRVHGNRWTEIARMVGGRTDNAVKNRWAALCKRGNGCGSGGVLSGNSGKRGRGAAMQASRAGASSRRKRDEYGEMSDDEEEEEDEEEDEEIASDASDDEPRRQRRCSKAQQHQHQRHEQHQQLQQRQQQQHQHQQHQQQQQGRARLAPALAGLSDANSPSQRCSAHLAASQSPEFASAVGVARSVLVSTGVLMQPLQRLGPAPPLSRLFRDGLHRQEQVQQAPQYGGSQFSTHGQPCARGVPYGPPSSIHDQTGPLRRQQQRPHLQQQQQEEHHQQHLQQTSMQQWRGQTTLELGSSRHMHLKLGQMQQLSGLGPGDMLAPGYGNVAGEMCCDGSRQLQHGFQVEAPRHQQFAPPVKRQSVDHQLQVHSDASATTYDVAALRLRHSPQTQPSLPTRDGWQQNGSGGISISSGGGGSFEQPHPLPAAPHMSEMRQAAEPGPVFDGTANPTAARPAQRSMASHLGGAMATSTGYDLANAVKRPPELSISIPHGPDADPVPSEAVNFQIKVFAERLTPAEHQHACEINEMGLPVQIHMSDEPPVTNAWQAAAQQQAKTVPRPLMEAAGGTLDGNDASDGLDSPVDWLSRLDKLLESEGGLPGLTPAGFGLALAHSPTASGSPRRPLTRSVLRGSPQARGSPLGRKQEETAAAVAARASLALRQRLDPSASPAQGSSGNAAPGHPDHLLAAQGTPGGPSLSPSATRLMSSLQSTGGALQDRHKQLLSRLLHGAKTTQEGLSMQRVQAASGALLKPATPLPQAPQANPTAVQEPSGVVHESPTSNNNVQVQEQPEGLLSPGYLPLPLGDVLMAPHLSAEEMHSMLDFLESFDTPKAHAF